MLTFPIGKDEYPSQRLRTFLRSALFPPKDTDLLALSLFACPSEPSVLANPRIGYMQNEVEASKVVDCFVAEGSLEEASSDLIVLLRIESAATLKSLAKERKLSCAGTKETLAKRLVNADPEAMRARFKGKRFLVCTAKGKMLVDKRQEVDRHNKMLAENECLRALKEGRLEDACLAVAAYEKTRLIPRGLGIDWQNYEISHDLLILETLFAAQLPRHSEFKLETMARVREAAAMIHLWGTNNPSPWLPEDVVESQIDWGVKARMLLFHALERVRLQDMKDAGAKRVEVLTSGSVLVCPVCRADEGKTYPLDDAPSLPHQTCTCEEGCACTLVAIKYD